MEKKSLLVAKAPVEIRRAHMKPTTFLKKYGRIDHSGSPLLFDLRAAAHLVGSGGDLDQ